MKKHGLGSHDLGRELEKLARLEAEVLALEGGADQGNDTRPCRCRPMPHKTRQCALDCQCWCHRSPDYRGNRHLAA